MTDISEEHIPALPPQMKFENKEVFQVAGFWRRMFAFLIDVIILAIPAEILGVIFFKYLNAMGSETQLFGLLFLLPYFGIMNSKLGNGQTLGKRIFHIAVRDPHNKCIGLKKSLLRTSFLFTNIFISGLSAFISIDSIAQLILGSIALAVMFGIIFLFLINKKSRQGLHDLIFGTYVVNLKGTRLLELSGTKKANWVATRTLMVIILIAYVLGSTLLSSKSAFPDLQNMVQLVATNPKVISVRVGQSTSRMISGSTSTTSKILTVQAHYRDLLKNETAGEAGVEIAKIILDNYEEINEYDAISITLTNGFDLGFVNYGSSYRVSKSVSGWRHSINGN